MQEHVASTMQECTDASDQERISFPEVVMKLMQAGVERYHADLLRAEKTYYLPSGESHRVEAAPTPFASLPRVTIQLPLYNERLVVERTLPKPPQPNG